MARDRRRAGNRTEDDELVGFAEGGGEELRARADLRRRASSQAVPVPGGEGSERGAAAPAPGRRRGDGGRAAGGVDGAVRAAEDREVLLPPALLRPRQQAARLLQEAAQGQHGTHFIASYPAHRVSAASGSSIAIFRVAIHLEQTVSAALSC